MRNGNPVGRPSELSRQWQALVDAVGGAKPLMDAIGVSKMTLWRMTTGKMNPKPDHRKKVAMLAKLHDLPDPLGDIGPKFKPDVRALELFGEALATGVTMHQTAEHFKFIWSDESLIELAESSDNENVLRAVTYLLEE